MFERLATKWRVFEYNFSWDDYSSYLNGNIAKASFFIPILGYAVIFNDYVTDNMTFKNLAGEFDTTFFLNSEDRLRFLYFGFLFLAFANIAYRLFRPYALKIGENLENYSNYFLTYAPSHAFLRLHQEIRHSGQDPWTQDGKYYDDEWQLFWREAQWPESGQGLLDKDTPLENLSEYARVDYEEAKKHYFYLSLERPTFARPEKNVRNSFCVCFWQP